MIAELESTILQTVAKVLVALLLGVVVWRLVCGYKKDLSPRAYKLDSVFFCVVALMSWVLNFGYYRMLLSFVLFPLVHSAAFLFVSFKSAKYLSASPRLKLLNLLYAATFMLPHLLLPDSADDGVYLLMSSISVDKLTVFFSLLALAAFVGNVVLFFLCLAQIKQTQKEWVADDGKL